MSTAWAAILDSCLSWCHRLPSPAVSELSTAEFRGEEGRPARRCQNPPLGGDDSSQFARGS